MTERKFDDALHLYRALIYDNVKAGDDRLQVRIMPYMAEISGDEEDNLPKYPPFFRGKVIRGYTEKDKESGMQPTSVYVLANNNFTVGYVLGAVNEFNGAAAGALTSSWNYQESKASLQRAGAVPPGFDYNNIEVTMNEGGTIVEMTSYKDAFKIIMTSSGDIFSIQNGKIFMMARSGAGQNGVESSYVKITPSKIECKSKVFDLSKSEAVILGHHGLNVLGSYTDTPVACEGINLTPCTGIKL